MAYKFIEHTADIRLGIKNEDLKGLFVDAFLGLMEFLGSKKLKTSGLVKRLISVSSGDLTSLLIDFLNEVLATAQINKEIYHQINFLHFPEENDLNFFIEAEIIGGVVEKFEEDVKAVTYHNACLEKNASGEWEIVITFDI